MNKHIELLSQFPNSYFKHFADIAKRMHENKPLSHRSIAYLYSGLAVSLSNGSKHIDMPQVSYFPTANGFYKILDYINPYFNHIYEYVYDSQFSLPKMYKNLIAQGPTHINVIAQPKKGGNPENSAKYVFDFGRIANIEDMDYFSCMLTEYDYEKHLDACYNALVKMLEKVNLVRDETPSNKKGSVILTRELNNLLFSQNMILRRFHEVNFAPTAREEIINDIIRHKSAMFGELKHDWKHYHKVKAAINYKKAQSKESER